MCVTASPDLEVFQTLSIHFVEEEVWQLLAQLVEAKEETLHVAELQLGLLVCRVLSILHLVWWQRHELLRKQKKHNQNIFVTTLVYNQLGSLGVTRTNGYMGLLFILPIFTLTIIVESALEDLYNKHHYYCNGHCFKFLKLIATSSLYLIVKPMSTYFNNIFLTLRLTTDSRCKKNKNKEVMLLNVTTTAI